MARLCTCISKQNTWMGIGVWERERERYYIKSNNKKGETTPCIFLSSWPKDIELYPKISYCF